MIRGFKAIIVVLPILLGGCESPFGLALSGLVGAGAATGGQAALKAWEVKLQDRAEWRAKHKELITLMVNAMTMEANRLMIGGNYDEAMSLFEQVIEFHNDQHPKLLIEKLVSRAGRKTVEEVE